MKRTMLFLMALVWITGATQAVWAQDRADRLSQVERAKLFLSWMKQTSAQLDEELLQARREQNSKKINCIEDRLKSLDGLIEESGGLYEKLRAFAMQQRVDEANKAFAKLDHNRGLAEQIVKLVNECLKNINVEGGFVETLQEWLGDPNAEDPTLDDPTASDPRSGVAEPVPEEFTPGPVSEENEEN